MGVYLPPIDEDTEGTLVTGITDTEYSFLCDILERRSRKPPLFVTEALIDYMITCGVRWWRNWRTQLKKEKPSREEIERSGDYDYHSMMAHLSLKQENQELIRQLVAEQWHVAKNNFYEFGEDSPDNHLFRQRWRNKLREQSTS